MTGVTASCDSWVKQMSFPRRPGRNVFTTCEILGRAAEVSFLYWSHYFTCIKFDCVRLMASLGNKSPPGVDVMHFSLSAAGILYCSPSMKLHKNRLASAKNMKCFCGGIGFWATNFSQEVHNEDLAHTVAGCEYWWVSMKMRGREGRRTGGGRGGGKE